MNRNKLYIAGLISRAVFTYPVLVIGALIVLGLAVELNFLGKPASKPLTADEKKSKLFERGTVFWQPDGTYHVYRHSRGDQYVIVDTEGKKIWSGKYDEYGTKYIQFPHTLRCSNSSVLSPVFRHRLKKPLQLGTSGDMFLPIQDNKGIRETWQVSPAFDSINRFQANGDYSGTLGKNGFVDSELESKPFGPFRMALHNSASQAYWVTEQQVYEVDLDIPSCHPLLSDNSSVAAIERMRDQRIHVTTDDGVHYVYNEWAMEPFRLCIHDASNKPLMGSIAFHGEHDHLYLYQKSDANRGDGRTYEEALYRVDKDGLATEVNRFEWTYYKQDTRGNAAFLFLMFEALNPVWPRLLPEVKEQTWPLLSGYDHQVGGFRLLPMTVIEFSGKSIVGWILFTALLLAAGIRIKGFSGLPTIGWGLFVLLAGFPAWLSWLAIAPRCYARCSACRKRIKIEGAACSHCEQLTPPMQALLIHNPIEVKS